MSSGKCSLEVSRLIAEVNRRPELWDRQHPQHHNRSVLDHHWECVAASLRITGKAARGKWKNLKDHFRKEYKRCMSSANADQEVSKWPYFYSMMFIREQISHTATDASAVYLTDFRYGRNVYNPEPEVSVVQGGGRGGDSPPQEPAQPPVDQNCDYDEYDDDDGYRPLNCLHVEYGNNNGRHADDQDENNSSYSEDKHFLLSLVPIFSTLSPDKKLKARIAIETSLLNIAYPDIDGRTSPTSSHRVVERNGTLQKQASPTTPNTNTTPVTAVDNTVDNKTEYDTNTTPSPTTTLNTTSATAVDNTAATSTAIKAEYDTNTTPTTTLNTISATPNTPNTTAMQNETSTPNSISDTTAATTTTATCTVVKAEYKERKAEDDQTYQRSRKKARKCY